MTLLAVFLLSSTLSLISNVVSKRLGVGRYLRRCLEQAALEADLHGRR